MADKKSGSDNPWAEMSRLNLGGKEAKAPAPDSPRAAAVSAAATKVAADEAKPQSAVADEESEYTIDDLQAMSLKELQALALESGIDTKGMSKEDLIDALSADDVALTAENEEDEEEILLEDDEEDLEADEIDGEMSLEEALALLGEDDETEDDFSDGEFEEVEEEVQEGDANFELDDNNSKQQSW